MQCLWREMTSTEIKYMSISTLVDHVSTMSLKMRTTRTCVLIFVGTFTKKIRVVQAGKKLELYRLENHATYDR